MIDLSKVFPRIKGVFTDEYPDWMPAESQNVLQLDHADSFVSREFAPGIAIFYGLDSEHSYQLIQNRDLSEEITIDKLHEASITNMINAVAETTEVQGDTSDLLMITNGGNFEATMMLMDFVWEQIGTMLNDEICVAIPARDLLFITGKNNLKGREHLRKMVRLYFENNETTGLIVRHIYERSNNGWLFVETA